MTQDRRRSQSSPRLVLSCDPISGIPVSGTGRYVWIRVTLDDRQTSDVGQATYLSDIVVFGNLPPAAGEVNDGTGANIDTQSSTSAIHANWTGFTAAPGDPIAFYEWAIGSSPGATNLQFWTNVGLSTSASNSTLTLSGGTKFVSVRAVSASGLKSAVATSDGVQVPGHSGSSGVDDDDDKGRCEQSATAGFPSGAALRKH